MEGYINTNERKEEDVMALLVATFFKWKSEVTEEKRNNLIKRGQELFEKSDFVKPVSYASVLSGSKYRYVSTVEYPNYSAIDKLMESPELVKHVSEFFANCEEFYQMMFRTLPIP